MERPRGNAILEVAIGVSLALPFLLVLFAIFGYLRGVWAAQNIAVEAARAFDIQLIGRIQGVEDTMVRPILTVPELRQFTERLSAQLATITLPKNSNFHLNFGIQYVEVALENGKAKSKAGPPVISYTNHLSSTSIINSLLEQEYSRQFNSQPFPYAIPHGLSEIKQISYLGASGFYSEKNNLRNDIDESRFFRFAPIVALSVTVDISRSFSGRIMNNLKYHLCRIRTCHDRGQVSLIQNSRIIASRAPM